MKRRTARKKAMQALFQMDLTNTSAEDAIASVLNHEEPDSFMENLVVGTTKHIDEIDQLIRQHLKKWSLERIGNIDRSILRIAVYEMKFKEDIPFNVSINEAIELAKSFGDADSSKFINAVLSKIKDSLDD